MAIVWENPDGLQGVKGACFLMQQTQKCKPRVNFVIGHTESYNKFLLYYYTTHRNLHDGQRCLHLPQGYSQSGIQHVYSPKAMPWLANSVGYLKGLLSILNCAIAHGHRCVPSNRENEGFPDRWSNLNTLHIQCR